MPRSCSTVGPSSTTRGGHRRSRAGIAAGEARRIRLPGSAGTALLGNKGGEIVLRASDGTPIHRVAYAKADVGPDGWTVLF